MRRKDKEIKELAAIEEIIARAPVCRLALAQEDRPYVVPLNFGYADRTVYFHCAKEGRKLDMIAANPSVCFEVDLDHEIKTAAKGCDFSFKYKSVIGFGKASLVEGHEAKEAALRIIMAHYAEGGFAFEPKDTGRIAVVKVELEEITGKQSV